MNAPLEIRGDFDRDTKVEGGDGAYTAMVSPEWEIWGPVGGYMATTALRAGAAEAKIRARRGRSLVLIDTLGWPSAWIAHPKTKFRGPNLDVVAFFHQSARDSEWLLCEQQCQIGAGGLLGPSARIFTRDGRLVASGGGQLLCVPSPP